MTGSAASAAQRCKNSMQTYKKSLPTLDIGSHINARFQLRPEAEALAEAGGVSCKPLFGQAPTPLCHDSSRATLALPSDRC
jgi:hypothetical protein